MYKLNVSIFNKVKVGTEETTGTCDKGFKNAVQINGLSDRVL